MARQIWEHMSVDALETEGGVDHVIDGLASEGWELAAMAPKVTRTNDLDHQRTPKGLETFTRVHTWRLVFKRRVE
jgi:hypothetical protein